MTNQEGTMETTTRPLYEIAAEIKVLWLDVYFGAVPYLRAMQELDKVTDKVGWDSGKDVVLYFLSNAKTWRGEDAARIKNELRVMIGQKPVKPRATIAKPKAEPVDRAQRKADAMVVKHAVMRAMFCPFTDTILDMRRAVVVTYPGHTQVMAASHWDKVLAGYEFGFEGFQARVRDRAGDVEVKVYDGRKLFTASGSVSYR